MKKYSKTTGGFYATEINGDNIPADAIEITDDYYVELMTEQASGKVIVADKQGYPRAENKPEPTPEEAQKIRNIEARAYLDQTDWYVVRKAETGEEIPAEILEKRASARLTIVE